MATITRRGETYLVRWYDLAGGRRSRTAPTKRAAAELARDVENERALGRDWTTEAEKPLESAQVARVGAVALAFIADSRRRKRAATVKSLSGTIDRFIDFLAQRDPNEPDPPISILSRSLLGEFFDWTGGRAPATRNSYVQAVHLLWEWAADSDEYAEVTPRPRRLALPVVDSTPTIAATWAECDAVIDVLGRRPPTGSPSVVAYRLAVILRYTGLRARQGLSLEWRDVDLPAGLLTIRGELGKSRQERGGRVIPMSPHLIAELRTWPSHDHPRLVPSMVNVSSTSSQFAKAVAVAVDEGRVRKAAFARRSEHAFRKAFVTELRGLGADVDAVEYLVGHSAGIRGVYTDPRALALVNAVSLVTPIATTEAEPTNVVRITAGSKQATA